MSNDHMDKIPPELTEEIVERFPGLAALSVIYENHVLNCTKCELYKTRNRVVFGTGNTEKPVIAFLGEAPGEDEDIQGYPFVGKAGKLLTSLIDKLGMTRQDVYILNTVCCRPPGNRIPTQDERAACNNIMRSQLRAVRPKIIVCLGAIAARTLLDRKGLVSEFRNKWWVWNRTPVRVTYHPSYLLRSPEMRTETWKDMQAVMEKIGKADKE